MNGTPLPKKKKKQTNAQLKKKLDEVFSEHIRRSFADKSGFSSCYTCGKKATWKELQCGHFLSRSYLATRFDERNCRPQCVGCNVFGGGKQVAFAERLSRELGEGIITELYKKAQEIVKDFPYEEKISYYQEKLLAIEKKYEQSPPSI